MSTITKFYCELEEENYLQLIQKDDLINFRIREVTEDDDCVINVVVLNKYDVKKLINELKFLLKEM
jgi:hypothetical protein